MKILLGLIILSSFITTACSKSKETSLSAVGVWEQVALITPEGATIEVGKAEFLSQAPGEDNNFLHLDIDEKTVKLDVLSNDGNHHETQVLYSMKGNTMVFPKADGLEMSDLVIVSVDESWLVISIADDESKGLKLVFKRITREVMDSNIKALTVDRFKKPDLAAVEETSEPILGTARPLEDVSKEEPRKIQPLVRDGELLFSLMQLANNKVLINSSVSGRDLVDVNTPMKSYAWALFSSDLKKQLNSWTFTHSGSSVYLPGPHAEVMEFESSRDLDFKTLKIGLLVNQPNSVSVPTHYLDLGELCETHPESFINLETQQTGCDHL